MRKLLTFVVFGFMVLVNSCQASENKEVKEEVNSKSNAEEISQSIAYGEAESEKQTEETNYKISKSRQNAITQAVEKCSPAIVGINVTEVKQVVYRNRFFNDPLFEHFFGGGRQRVREYEVKGLGSGFIISPDGYILTNHHVAGSASEVVVTMTDGTQYNAEIIGSDMVSDVALLKIDANKKLPYLEFSNSDDVIIGEWAIAFGNPFGLFDINAKPTVTVGVVSNKDVNFINEDQPYNRVYRDMIQTDAAISSGNSGGPLVNAEGKVIGMNTVIYSTAQNRTGAGSIGIGFSIPINRVKEIVDKLQEDKSINRNFITGMEVRELDEKLARYLGIDTKHGVVVFEMLRNGPAAKAGFELGDIIVRAGDMPILRDDDYFIAINDGIVGETLNFVIKRDGEEKIIKMKLENRR